MLPDIMDPNGNMRYRPEKEAPLHISGTRTGSNDSLETAKNANDSDPKDAKNSPQRQGMPEIKKHKLKLDEILYDQSLRKQDFRNTMGSSIFRTSNFNQYSELKQHLDKTLSTLTPGQLSQSIDLSTLMPRHPSNSNRRSKDRLSSSIKNEPLHVSF